MPASTEVVCPKCKLASSDTIECAHCGVNFEGYRRYLEHQQHPEQSRVNSSTAQKTSVIAALIFVPPILLGVFFGDILFKPRAFWNVQLFVILPISFIFGCLLSAKKWRSIESELHAGAFTQVRSPLRVFRPQSPWILPLVFAMGGPAWTYGFYVLAAHVSGGVPFCYESTVVGNSRGETRLSVSHEQESSIVSVNYASTRQTRPQLGEPFALAGHVNWFGSVVSEKRRGEHCAH